MTNGGVSRLRRNIMKDKTQADAPAAGTSVVIQPTSTKLGSASSGYGVGDEATLSDRHARFVVQNKGRAPTLATRALLVYVSDNRWVGDCDCRSGVLAHPGWAAYCFGCGAIYRDIVWPLEMAAIESELMTRQVSDRHWRPREMER